MTNKQQSLFPRLFLLVVLLQAFGFEPEAQPSGYYNGTEGLEGSELKSTLHYLIDQHLVFSYFSAKDLLSYSDADPLVSGNVILVYSGTSHPGDDYGTGSNQLNREHVWAKSHGSFTDILPMYSDVHNLKPCDASINGDRGNKDFDEGGVAHQEAIGCYYTSSTWEPRDQDKGDIARIILYMAVRYEGDEGEIDLEAVDFVNTSPAPEHGKLSTLLDWNLQDPPDEFEMNRNNVIAAWQKNRNPFIDHPGFAQLIWGGESASSLLIGDITAYPQNCDENQEAIISAYISGTLGTVSATLRWGFSRYDLSHSAPMEISSGRYIGEIPGQLAPATVYYRIQAMDEATQTNSVTYSYKVNQKISGPITDIYSIQGQQPVSPFLGQVLNTTGIVTAFFGDYFFLQHNTGEWNGLLVRNPGYDIWVGDSLVVTGTVTENDGITELTGIEALSTLTPGNSLPYPLLIGCDQAGESYEGVLIKVEQAECTEADFQSNNWMWTIDDGSAPIDIHNTSIFEYNPMEGELYTVTGPLHQVDGKWCIELRTEEDVLHILDTDSPVVEAVEVINQSTVRVQFSENLDKQSAETEINYSINNGVIVLDANQQINIKKNIYLNVSALSNGEYELTIQNVKDVSGNPMVTSSHLFSFTSDVSDRAEKPEMRIFQDPYSDILTIDLTCHENEFMDFLVIDGMGRIMQEDKINVIPGENRIFLGMKDYPLGIYFIRVVSNMSVCSYKLIRQ
jgi:endonuclease I